MNTKVGLSVACGLAALMMGMSAQATEKSFDIGGDIELDLTGYDMDSGSHFGHGGRGQAELYR
ncbi:MAG: hypothetical protein R3E89_16865 [Thiolinea sp.]